MIKRCIWLSLLLTLFFTKARSQQHVFIEDAQSLFARFANGSDTTYVINFWATWCGPCRKELPEFEALHKKSAGKKLKVILISLDDVRKDAGKVADFVKTNQLSAETILLNDAAGLIIYAYTTKKYNGSLPATLIISPDKKHRFINGVITPAVIADLNKLVQ